MMGFTIILIPAVLEIGLFKLVKIWFYCVALGVGVMWFHQTGLMKSLRQLFTVLRNQLFAQLHERESPCDRIRQCVPFWRINWKNPLEKLTNYIDSWTKRHNIGDSFITVSN